MSDVTVTKASYDYNVIDGLVSGNSECCVRRDGLVVSMLASSARGPEHESRSDHTVMTRNSESPLFRGLGWGIDSIPDIDAQLLRTVSR